MGEIIMFNLLWPLVAFSGEPIQEIEVIAHEDIEVYVAPTIVKNESEKIEATIGNYSIFGYTSQYKNLAKVKDVYGWTTIDYSDQNVNVMNEDTIKYYWEDCDYKKEPKNCSYKNSHYLLESYITVDENQITLEMFLYDPELQIISSSRETSTIKINWIKQQEMTVQDNTMGSINRGNNCTQSSCPVQSNSGTYVRNRSVSKPKEEHPIRWDIPPMLLNKHVQQCTIRLWSSVKFKL